MIQFCPEKILRLGGAVLGAGVGVCALCWGLFFAQPPLTQEFSVRRKGNIAFKQRVGPFSLGLKEEPLASFQVERQTVFSLDPPRPDSAECAGGLFIRFNKSAESRRVSVPCRLDLRCLSDDGIGFFQGESPLWLELAEGAEGGILAQVWLEFSSQEKVLVERFPVRLQERPFQEAREFPHLSPFRVLGEARWLGRDLFLEKHGEGKQSQRIVFGEREAARPVGLNAGEWLVWEEGQWKRGEISASFPIARIEREGEKALFLEGWDGARYVRLSLQSVSGTTTLMQGEGLFSSIRIRSDKQISCVLEKRCLILQIGDWVLKSDARWKVLRKPEEKDAYRAGEQRGDLFVFEGIELKQGQKIVRGSLFNEERTQMLAMDLETQGRAIHKGRQVLLDKGRIP